MHIFIYPALKETLRDRIEAEASGLGTIDFNASKTESCPDRLRNSDVIFGNPPLAWVEPVASQLKFWQLDSAGFHQYSGIKTQAIVCNMGDYFAIPCAETMLSGILGFYRLFPELIRLQQQKKWVGTPLRSGMDVLTGKNVLILGAGTIGRAIAKMLRGFDCNVTFVARTSRADVLSFEDALPGFLQNDIVINALPGNADKVVSGLFFESMRPGTLYASVGRGNTTDENAMIKALTSGKLLGAVLDVTLQEPLPAGHVLWDMPNVILTQHTGGGQKNEEDGKVDLFLKNLKLFADGKPLRHQVALSKGY